LSATVNSALKLAVASVAVVAATAPAVAFSPDATANPPPRPRLVQSSHRSVTDARSALAQLDACAVEFTSVPVATAARTRQLATVVVTVGHDTLVSDTSSVAAAVTFHGSPDAMHPLTPTIRAI
jgi:hypothetical protein